MVEKNYICESCEGKPEFPNSPAFRDHLQKAHNIDPDHLSGTRELQMHINAGRTHTTQDRITLDAGVVFLMITRSTRGRS